MRFGILLVIAAGYVYGDSSNAVTIQSYEEGVNEYIAGTPHDVSGKCKAWIDETLGLLPSNAEIIEIGSAFGRDAQYIESCGYVVERTDATEGFVALLQEKGYPVRKFNILTDEFTVTHDLVFANAVFLHFTRQELQMTLDKINVSLNKNGILAFSVKKGEGEGWSTAKIGRPRYFCYWTPDTIHPILKLTGFELVSISEDEIFMYLVVRKL